MKSIMTILTLAGLYAGLMTIGSFANDATSHPTKEITETCAYLGIATSPVGAPMSAQLDLTRGVGLVIEHVDPESPAAAGLQLHDILHRMDDQILVSHDQLAVLIRTHKPGDKVTLSVIRKGKKESVSVKLGEKQMPPINSPVWKLPEIQFPPPGFGAFHDEARERIMKELQQQLENAGMATDKAGQVMENMGQSMQEWSQKRLPHPPGGTRRHMKMRMDENPIGSSITTLSNGISLTLTKDAHGNETLVATDNTGKQLFSGPVNTKEEITHVPPDIRKKLDDLRATQKELIEIAPADESANER